MVNVSNQLSQAISNETWLYTSPMESWIETQVRKYLRERVSTLHGQLQLGIKTKVWR